MRPYDTYLFDLDGTLLDTLDDLADATNHALAAHGLPARTRDEVRRAVGNGVAKLIERSVPRGTGASVLARVLDDFRMYYAAHAADKTRPYPGITETLAELRRRGKKIAVVSNKTHTVTQNICSRFFGTLIDAAIGENEPLVRKKPAPDMVIQALDILGADTRHSVYVGDSDVDIDTARAAGIPCIAVLWGFRDKDSLEAHAAATAFPLALVARPHELL